MSAVAAIGIPTPVDAVHPIPLSIEDTGLSRSFLEDLLARKMMEIGAADVRVLSEAIALSSNIVDTLLSSLRSDARIESHSPAPNSTMLRYALTDAGRKFASDATARSPYSGPAPIHAEHYQHLVRSQTTKPDTINRDAMQAIYHDVVLEESLIDRLGAAMNSGRAMFVYGPAGTGKTFVCKRLIQLLAGNVYIPHAVLVGDSIVNVYDPAIHEAVENPSNDTALIAAMPDPRLVLCKRPFVCSGGELSADMLEIAYDPLSNQYNAPLQQKATHGIFMIDDLGRQKMPTGELFNRWIVPMESREDFLGLPSGQRLLVPFDVLLVFSTNLDPGDLSDPAFQRRVGHKIRFEPVSASTFRTLWLNECERLDVGTDETLADYVIHELFIANNKPLLASQPRDLIGMARDFSLYDTGNNTITRTGVLMAWDNYSCSASDSTGQNVVNL